jgi:hypothetical protein
MRALVMTAAAVCLFAGNASAQAVYNLNPRTGSWSQSEANGVHLNESGQLPRSALPRKPTMSTAYPQAGDPTIVTTEQNFANGDNQITILGSDGSSFVMRGQVDDKGQPHYTHKWTPGVDDRRRNEKINELLEQQTKRNKQ